MQNNKSLEYDYKNKSDMIDQKPSRQQQQNSNISDLKTLSFDIDHDDIHLPYTKSSNEVFLNAPSMPDKLSKELSFNIESFISKKSSPNMPTKFKKGPSTKRTKNRSKDIYVGQKVVPKPELYKNSDKKNTERSLDNDNELGSLLNSHKIPIQSSKFHAQ